MRAGEKVEVSIAKPAMAIVGLRFMVGLDVKKDWRVWRFATGFVVEDGRRYV